MRFTVAQPCVVTSAFAQTNAPALNSGACVGLVQDLMDRGLVACTATDARDATLRVPCSIWNEWSLNLTEEELL